MISEELDNKNKKLEDQANQLKQLKERTERIKTIASIPSKEKPALDLFTQMKKQLESHTIKPQSNSISCQTDPTDFISVKEPKNESDLNTVQLLHLVLGIALRGSAPKQKIFDSLIASFENLDHTCSSTNLMNRIHATIYLETMELYLEMIFRNMKNFSDREVIQFLMKQFLLAGLVYNSLSRGQGLKSLEKSRSELTIVYMHLIPVLIINQEDVLEALLQSLLEYISRSAKSKAVVAGYGTKRLFQILISTPNNSNICNLASSILVALLSEGTQKLNSETYLGLLETCQDSFVTIMAKQYPLKTIDNISVILHRLSKNSKLGTDIIIAIKGLLDQRISQFAAYNFKAIIHNETS
jgi:hypothetical protein